MRDADFKRALDVSQIATDLSDLATLSPLAVPARIVSIGARVERIVIVDLPQAWLTLGDLDCEEYLSKRAGALVFDPDQPEESCTNRSTSFTPSDSAHVLVSYRPKNATELRIAQKFDDAKSKYAQNANAILDAARQNDVDRVNALLPQLDQATSAVTLNMDAARTLLLNQPRGLNAAEAQLLGHSDGFAVAHLEFLVALANCFVNGASASADLTAAYENVLEQLDAYQVSLVATSLPNSTTSTVLLGLPDARFAGGQASLQVPVANIGAGASDALQIQVHSASEASSILAVTSLAALPPGGEETAYLGFTPAATSHEFFVVDLMENGAIVDSKAFALDLTNSNVKPPEPASSPNISPTRANSSNAFIIVIMSVAVVAIAGAVGFFILTRAAPRKSGAQMSASRSITIGRDPHCTLVVSDSQISRRHAEITNTNGLSILTDLGSKNGTFVNGHKIMRHTLREGDRIRVGSHEFVFQGATLIETGSVLSQQIPSSKLKRAVLVISDGTSHVKSIPIGQGPLVLGRDDVNELGLADPLVSRRHAEISHQGGEFVLRDLTSANGTWVNGKRIRQSNLHDGDEIRLGKTILVFKVQ